MFDFIAVSANLMSSESVVSSIVIEMIPMPGRHEHINIAVEEIINGFEFDKSKLIGITTDEGSSMLRLFKPMLNMDELDIESSLLIDLEEAELEVLFQDEFSFHEIEEVNIELCEIGQDLKQETITNKLTSMALIEQIDLNDLI